MEGRIRGSWPGGPRRDGEPQERTRPPQLQRVEEIEARSASRLLRVRRGARTKRLVLGVAFFSVIALAFGWVLGLRSHTTLEEMQSAQSQQRAARDADMTSEINRVMLELWKMEDVEYARNRGGR